MKRINKTYANKKDKLFLALEKARGNITDACVSVGICRATFYKWLKENKDLKDYIDIVQEQAIDYVENKLFDLIKDKNTAAIIFYLKTKGKKRGYIEKQEISIDNAELPFNMKIESRTNNSTK